MTIGDKVSSAVSNLGRRKVRTVLTSLGVVVGTLTIVTMVSLALGVRRQINEQFAAIGLDRVIVRPPGESGGNPFNPFNTEKRTKLITPQDVQNWQRWPGVTELTAEVDLPWDIGAGLQWKNKIYPTEITGETARRRNPFSSPPTPVAGTLELSPKGGGVVLSGGLVRDMKIGRVKVSSLLNQPVTVVLQTARGETRKFPLRVRGISSQDGPAIQLAPADRIAMKSWWFNTPNILQKEGYDVVTLRTRDVSAASNLVPRFKKAGFRVDSIERILEVANRIFSVITVMLGLVGGVALLVASIGIANTMIMAIYERTREIGTLKAMGASRSDIRQRFMIEAGLIGLLGGVVGLLGGWALGRILNQAIHWYGQQRSLPLTGDFFLITPLFALQVLFFATLIGILAGLYPAQRAAKLDPLAALRHE